MRRDRTKSTPTFRQAKEDFFVDGLQPAGMEERMRAGEQVFYGYVYGSLVPCAFWDANEQAPVFPARGWAVYAC